MCVFIRVDHFRFGSVRFLSKKNNQTEIFFFLKKNRNRVKPTGFGSVRFFRAKTGSNRFGSVLWFWLGFLGFFRFGSVWLGFLSVSVRFGFSSSLFIKPKPNRTSRFFQKINRFNQFFFRFSFFGYFFPVFFGLIGFPVFFLTSSFYVVLQPNYSLCVDECSKIGVLNPWWDDLY